jgi:ATP-dependent RNA circularization protein (DNA/RNA ligase family)
MSLSSAVTGALVDTKRIKKFFRVSNTIASKKCDGGNMRIGRAKKFHVVGVSKNVYICNFVSQRFNWRTRHE